jgi:hypothetical protein
MEFKDFKVRLQNNFNELAKEAGILYEVSLDKDVLWNLYLDSFPAEENVLFRQRRGMDCSGCRTFVRNFGNIGFIINNKFITIWDFDANDATYQPVIDALANFVRSKAVSDVYVSKQKKIGTDKNLEKIGDTITEWNHLYVELPNQLVVNSAKSEAEIRGGYRDQRNVFKRSLDEISEDSLLTVLELSSQNSLYKGEEWIGALTEFLSFKRAYDQLPNDEKENYAWQQSVKLGGGIGKIRNHSIGTLLIDISEGEELDLAVRKYEKIVAPHNYKRTNAIYSDKMVKDAKKLLEEKGYLDSLERRHATLDDITVNNILFSNKDSAKRIQGAASVFKEMSKGVPVNIKNFSKVEEVAIDTFIENILPTAREIEVYLENRHAINLASLIAPVNKTALSMFKWTNAFSWAYAGNITDSPMKENVKSAGGNVNGVLRFSIQWNDSEHDANDLDAHCIEPNGNEIYYGTRNRVNPTTGQLDVDIINPVKGEAAVENITWTDVSKMQEGVYKFFVQNYSHRGGRTGFKAEIEYDGQIFSFDYGKEVRQKENVQVAEVTFSKIHGFSIKEMLPSNVSSREVWGLKTNQFVPVSVVCFSPNYWDQQHGIGHRHYMFMLKDCVNPEKPNGFYNEFLNEELMPHRKVCDALGSKMAVASVADQLSGLGFSSTKRNDLLVKVKGSTERVIKIKF